MAIRPFHPREVERRAAPALVERRAPDTDGDVAEGHQVFLVGLVRLLAGRANLADEALGNHQHQRGGDQERRDAHVDEPRDGRR